MSLKREAMISVCSAPTLLESLIIFEANKDILKDCKFIFTSEGVANIPEYSRQRKFSKTAGVYNIFASEKIVVLDTNIIEAMKKGTARYSVDYSVSLDAMAVSYLRPYLNNRENRIPEDFKEVFCFLAQEDVNIDPMPYMTENISNITDPLKIDSIFEILKSYEILKNIDIKLLNENNIIRSRIPEKKINDNAMENLNSMFEISRDRDKSEYIKSPYNLKYCLLLKMALIQLKNPRKENEKKLLELIEFCDSRLNRILLREVVIACKYFEVGQNLTFFGKIQKGSIDLIKNLKNMAWDLYHISEMERGMTYSFTDDTNYYLPVFLTFDTRLTEILQLYRIEAIGFSVVSQEIVPVSDIEQSIDSPINKRIISEYLSEEARGNRSLRKNQPINVHKIIETLEEEIGFFAK